MKSRYTYEVCKQLANGRKSRYEFRRKCPGAYRVSVKNGWISDFLKPIVQRNLDYDYCRSVASTCQSRAELVKKDQSVYYKALAKGWIDEFSEEFSYMDSSDAFRQTLHENGKYMTDDELEAEARKYKTLAAFRHRSPSAYMRADNRGLIKKYTWLKRCPKSALPKNGDVVYVYEFGETHAAYVGRTINLERRDSEHRRKKNDSLNVYSAVTGIPIPTPRILHTGIKVERGAELEQSEIERYRAEGWTMINRCRGGSIGTLGVGISKNKIIRTSKQYTTFVAFKKDHLDMVSLIYRMGWEKDFPWLEKKEYTHWTRELCEEESRKYTLLKDFRTKSSSAYVTAKANGWLKDYTWLGRRINWNDFDNVAREAKKYKTRDAFGNGNKSAYVGARRNGWLDRFYPPLSSVKPGHWNVYENVESEARKYSSRSDWDTWSHGSYEGARRNGWLDMLMPSKYNRQKEVTA